MSQFKRGNFAETIILNYLFRLGFDFIDRNYNTPYGEIDLIMKKLDHYFFIEVKSNFSKRFVNPYEKISEIKTQRIFDSVMIWIQNNGIDEQKFFLKYFFISVTKDRILYLQLENI
ncbi:MAG: hypothetical protein KatS3mg085_021 [Candidatus Dojkabacteria bacterium]|nr:MAG: hypothetical protein KatS3mg085_021 [Candidatus Dojkabacteria bacterium]GIW58925.1 MAG: hypothetical protein KatS3mg086_210 [Candidatus Dojkabacteria bacterium]